MDLVDFGFVFDDLTWIFVILAMWRVFCDFGEIYNSGPILGSRS